MMLPPPRGPGIRRFRKMRPRATDMIHGSITDVIAIRFDAL
jgi:hypothetical protein